MIASIFQHIFDCSIKKNYSHSVENQELLQYECKKRTNMLRQKTDVDGWLIVSFGLIIFEFDSCLHKNRLFQNFLLQ